MHHRAAAFHWWPAFTLYHWACKWMLCDSERVSSRLACSPKETRLSAACKRQKHHMNSSCVVVQWLGLHAHTSAPTVIPHTSLIKLPLTNLPACFLRFVMRCRCCAGAMCAFFYHSWLSPWLQKSNGVLFEQEWGLNCGSVLAVEQCVCVCHDCRRLVVWNAGIKLTLVFVDSLLIKDGFTYMPCFVL